MCDLYTCLTKHSSCSYMETWFGVSGGELDYFRAAWCVSRNHSLHPQEDPTLSRASSLQACPSFRSYTSPLSSLGNLSTIRQHLLLHCAALLFHSRGATWLESHVSKEENSHTLDKKYLQNYNVNMKEEGFSRWSLYILLVSMWNFFGYSSFFPIVPKNVHVQDVWWPLINSVCVCVQWWSGKPAPGVFPASCRVSLQQSPMTNLGMKQVRKMEKKITGWIK